MRVLVAYATKNGSTREVAEEVAAALRERGDEVVLRPAAAAGPVTGFALAVLGAPLYAGRWHRDAHRFLRRHRGELAGLPVAVFGLGPRRDAQDAWWRARTQLARAVARHRWLGPAASCVFGGVDPPGQGQQRDLRDYQTVRAWVRHAVPPARPAPQAAAPPSPPAGHRAR